jgi:hypothetical protein
VPLVQQLVCHSMFVFVCRRIPVQLDEEFVGVSQDESFSEIFYIIVVYVLKMKNYLFLPFYKPQNYPERPF